MVKYKYSKKYYELKKALEELDDKIKSNQVSLLDVIHIRMCLLKDLAFECKETYRKAHGFKW